MTSMTSETLADAVRSAMRCTASGVAILATDGREGRAGVTVSTLCSLSLEPPSVIACVHKDSRTLRTVLANGVFSANILAEGQEAVASAFAGAFTDHQDRFGTGSWADLDGLPRLEGAVASFACRLADSHSFGTHVILIGEIFDVAATSNPPLIYADRAFHSLTAA
jgi:flavin reductase (DIM6/NTAB) family NADH-FMN oxidoreductase RutF